MHIMVKKTRVDIVELHNADPGRAVYTEQDFISEPARQAEDK